VWICVARRRRPRPLSSSSRGLMTNALANLSSLHSVDARGVEPGSGRLTQRSRALRRFDVIAGDAKTAARAARVFSGEERT